MVYIQKDFDGPPDDLIDAKWDVLKRDAIDSSHAHVVKSSCYRDTTIDVLSVMYHGKCAYCERHRGQELQVDHYRPKKRRDAQTEPQYNQPGYYWLAYEWSNLIALCSKCNRCKSNKFPLEGFSEANRIASHLNAQGDEDPNHYSMVWLNAQEKPLLLNPEIKDDFARHFLFGNNGSVTGRTTIGDATIDICGLDRDNLRLERINLLKSYAAKIQKCFIRFVRNNNIDELRGGLFSIFEDITSHQKEEQPYSLYHKFIYLYFDHYIGHHLSPAIRAKALDFFEEYRING